MARTVSAAYYRGGSSKAVFFHEDDIPKPGPTRDLFIKRLMGTPDPIQIDGMGGSRIITSKVSIVRRSDRPDADVDYTFAQVGIVDDTVGYGGNCGNISAAVGPFALSEGLVDEDQPGTSIVEGLATRMVRIYNTGTNKVIVSHVPVDVCTGEVVESGNFEIAAVPGTGAPILMDYSQTIGAAFGNGLLPSLKTTNKIKLGGGEVNITICDVANLIIFASAQDVGLVGSESADEINKEENIARLKEIRGRGAQLLGRCDNWKKVDEQSPFLPMVVIVAPDDSGRGHIRSRLILDNKCHDSMAGSGAICTAACSRISGSVVHQQLSEGAVDENTFSIHHPLGTMPVAVVVKEDTKNSTRPEFETLSFVRTARRIMTGQLYLPPEVEVLFDEKSTTNGAIPASRKKTKGCNVTEELCKFVESIKSDNISAAALSKVKDLLIDHIGVGASAASYSESSEPFLKAIRSLDANGGTSTVYTKGKKFSVQNAALLNGAFAHSFDFDDTFSAGASHPGVCIIPAALAEAEVSEASGRNLLTALAVGYEVSCRLTRALGTSGYLRGFHNTSTAGIFGAVAVIAKLRNFPPERISDAFGLAGSKAAGSMQFLENGAWNKRLHPGFAAHDAFTCVALAEAGVAGAKCSIEGQWGFLQAYSDSPNLENLTEALGTEWIFTSTALKPFPACRMTHAAIEVTADMRSSHLDAEFPSRIVVRLSPVCFNIVGVPDINKQHPRTVVDAQFSIYYHVAMAWLYGSDLGWTAYHPSKMADTRAAELRGRIEAVSDDTVKDLEARVSFFGTDGVLLAEKCLLYPLGEDENPFGSEKVKSKFLRLAVPVYGVDMAEKIITAVEDIEFKTARGLIDLL
ncbi:Fc.00g072580.m01.CDS01 [Cosmosporella sp. VM-42]